MPSDKQQYHQVLSHVCKIRTQESLQQPARLRLSQGMSLWSAEKLCHSEGEAVTDTERDTVMFIPQWPSRHVTLWVSCRLVSGSELEGSDPWAQYEDNQQLCHGACHFIAVASWHG